MAQVHEQEEGGRHSGLSITPRTVEVFPTVGQVKNFPHQYNDLMKLRATLETERDLQDRGLDSTDDAILGYELARRRIYGFRGLDYEGADATVDQRIAERIAAERTKPAGTQGARTAAREMRRTLGFLGWLQPDGTTLAAAGEALLATTEGSDEERILMQQAISSIPVEDRAGRLSHPVQILLRLVDEVALDSRAGMEVVLEAVDDSVSEFQRVAELAAMPYDARISALKSAGWTDPQLANAVKILPAFAIQSGLMTTDGGGRFILTDAGRRAIGRAVTATQPARSAVRRPPRRREATVTTSDPADVGRSRRLLDADRRTLSAAEQAMAAQLLYERTERHQRLVRAVAEGTHPAEFSEDAASYDLLVDLQTGGDLILIEVKTVAGDAHVQIRAAVGQLLYYDYFFVRPRFPDREVEQLVVVDDEVPGELAEFLEDNDIGLVAYLDEQFNALNDAGQSIASRLFT
jgi:hypothetical protein